MTKKVNKKGSSMTLRDFYEHTPGAVPIERCLPSKSGDVSRAAEQCGLEHSLSEVVLSINATRFYDSVESGERKALGPNGFGSGTYGYGMQSNGRSTRDPLVAKPFPSKLYEDRFISGYRPEIHVYDRPPALDVYDVPVKAIGREDSETNYQEFPYGEQHARGLQGPFAQDGCPAPPPPPPKIKNGGFTPSNSGPPIMDGAFGKQFVPSGRKSALVDLPPTAHFKPSFPSAAQIHSADPQKATGAGSPVSCDIKAPAKDQRPADGYSKPADPKKVPSPAAPPSLPHSNGASPPVKNEWADKMASAALARMANAKSSLLLSGGGGPVAAEVIVGQVVSPPERPRLNLKPRSSPLAEATVMAPATTKRATETDAAVRPKLSLQPRSLPLAAETGSNEDVNRPKLKLLPRSKPAAVPDAEALELARRNNVFGNARPREEVLKERGVEVGSLDSDRTLERVLHNSSRPVSRAASVTSASNFSEDDAWHTVSMKKGHRVSAGAPAGGQQGPHDVLHLDDDPFFGTHTKAPSSLRPAFSSHGNGRCQQEYSVGGYYGPPSDYQGAYNGHESTIAEEDDGPFFRRALPTRQELF